jgi:hypothetical protein
MLTLKFFWFGPLPACDAQGPDSTKDCCLMWRSFPQLVRDHKTGITPIAPCWTAPFNIPADTQEPRGADASAGASEGSVGVEDVDEPGTGGFLALATPESAELFDGNLAIMNLEISSRMSPLDLCKRWQKESHRIPIVQAFMIPQALLLAEAA